MNLIELKQKALEIRELYARKDSLESKKGSTIETVIIQFVSDVGDLSRCITQKERGGEVENLDENIARELAECLAHILVLSEKYGVNLEESFMKEFTRLHSELS